MVGPETQKAANWLFTADTYVPYGRAVYSCLLNKRGGIEADLLVTPITSGSGTQADPIFKVIHYFVCLCFWPRKKAALVSIREAQKYLSLFCFSGKRNVYSGWRCFSIPN